MVTIIFNRSAFVRPTAGLDHHRRLQERSRRLEEQKSAEEPPGDRATKPQDHRRNVQGSGRKRTRKGVG